MSSNSGKCAANDSLLIHRIFLFIMVTWLHACFETIANEPSGVNLKWLAQFLRANSFAPIWRTLRDVLIEVIAKYKDPDEAEELKRNLNAINHSRRCTNNEVRINEMVKTLEDVYISAYEALNWFIKVLEDPRVTKSHTQYLVGEIKKRIPPGPGPVNRR